MKPERALEVISEDGRESGKGTWEEYLEAIQLGIEALKRVKAYKEAHVGLHYEPMPGETEE